MHKQGASSNSQGVQHNDRLAKNTKKELGTAHHNDASSTGYFNNRNATPINLKGNMFCQHMQAHLQILLLMKKGYKQVNEKDF